MKRIVLKIEDSRFGALLQFLRTLDYVIIEQPLPSQASDDLKTIKEYDFSDLSGKLKWKGDAVSQQRTLRNEW